MKKTILYKQLIIINQKIYIIVKIEYKDFNKLKL